MGDRTHEAPNMVWVLTDDLPLHESRRLAQKSVALARQIAPKVSGRMAKRFRPIWGINYFGIRFQDPYTWFQENGISPFTMKSLEGKTIPMWIDDHNGKERENNPKAKTRTTKDGRTQVLIFRKATKPGAPGRITLRHARKPYTTAGKVGGKIHGGNVGVKWRHPGLRGRHFLYHGVVQAAHEEHLPVHQVVAEWADGRKEEMRGR